MGEPLSEEEKKLRRKEVKRKSYQKNKKSARESANSYRQENRERLLAVRRDRYQSNRIKYLLKSAKQRARANCLHFDLEESDLIIPDFCPVFNTRFEHGTRLSMSIDRIIPDKGYTKGNTQIISVLANTMKSNATPEELKMFAEWVLKNG